MARNYTFARFARSPVDRVFSMYTGTAHAGGPKPGSMSFEDFFSQLQKGRWSSNGHTQPATQLCNHNIGSARPNWQIWAAGSDPVERGRRVGAFVHELFGSRVYRRACAGLACPEDPERKPHPFEIFRERAERAATNEGTLSPLQLERYQRQIGALYSEDVLSYSKALARPYDRYAVPACALSQEDATCCDGCSKLGLQCPVKRA